MYAYLPFGFDDFRGRAYNASAPMIRIRNLFHGKEFEKGGDSSTERARVNRLLVKFSQTPSLVGSNRSVDDRSAVNAFPGIENEEEVGKPLHHHQAFAFRTIHGEPPNLCFSLLA